MEEKARAAVWGGFVADTLALGAHWIYDTERIDREIGRVEQPIAPSTDSFHPTKSRGDFTHYGDQLMVLLESVAAVGSFDLGRFFTAWEVFFGDYNGYFDHATKDTLKNIAEGKTADMAGSSSNDLSGASRVAALSYHCRSDETGFVAAARSQAAMTHADPHVVDAAEFFARVTAAVMGGETPTVAVQAVQTQHFDKEPFAGWVREGLESAGNATREAIKAFGQMCDIGAGFPGVIHLIARYEGRFRDGLVENVMAGGDSAARGILAGSVLGAYEGPVAIPPDWISAMNAQERIRSLIGR